MIYPADAKVDALLTGIDVAVAVIALVVCTVVGLVWAFCLFTHTEWDDPALTYWESWNTLSRICE